MRYEISFLICVTFTTFRFQIVEVMIERCPRRRDFAFFSDQMCFEDIRIVLFSVPNCVCNLLPIREFIQVGQIFLDALLLMYYYCRLFFKCNNLKLYPKFVDICQNLTETMSRKWQVANGLPKQITVLLCNIFLLKRNYVLITKIIFLPLIQ